MEFFDKTENKKLLEEINLDSAEPLFSPIPETLKIKSLKLPEKLEPQKLEKELFFISSRNKNIIEYKNFIGAGSYEHYIPPVVEYLLSRGEFLTAYTPYQAEASQGTLQAIYEYQSFICELTGMDVSNAGVYDGGSAVAESVLMCIKHTEKNKIFISSLLNPEYKKVLLTYLQGLEVEVISIPYDECGETSFDFLNQKLDEKTAAVVIQSPNFFGIIEDLKKFSALIHNLNALFVCVVNPITLAILIPPAEAGADIACGEGQSLGLPLYLGGCSFGFIATKEFLLRKLPGRIVGKTFDYEKNIGFVLTLQAREQHIRREKATSNICTNSNLMSLAGTIFLSILGKNGLVKLAEKNVLLSHKFASLLVSELNWQLQFPSPFFNEFVIETNDELQKILEKLKKNKIFGGLELSKFYPELKNHLLICVTETKSQDDFERYISVIKG